MIVSCEYDRQNTYIRFIRVTCLPRLLPMFALCFPYAPLIILYKSVENCTGYQEKRMERQE